MKITGLLVLFVIVAGVVGYMTLRVIVKSEDVVIVPDLVGKDVVYALELLTDLGLNTKVAGYEYRRDVAKNHIAHQDPAPGAEIKKGRDVRIVVSKGPEMVSTPNLVGLDIREAKIIIDENGLAEGVVSQTFVQGSRNGEVLSQAPEAGRVVTRATPVDLLVGLGPRPERFKMPRVIGCSPQEAIMVIEETHLGLGKILRVQRDDMPMDIVVEQHPRFGYPVTAGTRVDLTVNGRKETVFERRRLLLLHYPIPAGFLKTRIRLRVNAFGVFYDLLDRFWPPGQDVWAILPPLEEGAFFLYQDDALVVESAAVTGRAGMTMGRINTSGLRRRLKGES
ncbi:MAG: PASTA domain-containing protein [Deltaproteobacteria bacterium]|nr:PASTA domain-containing protein [Deltaproteobacteria bacterium]